MERILGTFATILKERERWDASWKASSPSRGGVVAGAHRRGSSQGSLVSLKVSQPGSAAFSKQHLAPPSNRNINHLFLPEMNLKMLYKP